jgi:hypothetical protein
MKKLIFLSLVTCCFFITSAIQSQQDASTNQLHVEDRVITRPDIANRPGIEGISLMVGILVVAIALLTNRKVREAMIYDL